MMRRILSALLLALATVAPARAQRASQGFEVDSLARVRVTQSAVDPERMVGALLGADSQVVVVRHGGERYALPLQAVRRLEVSRGRRPAGDGAMRGARSGFLGGLAVGVVGGLLIMAAGDGDGGDSWIGPEHVAGALVVVATGAGTVGGLLIGAASPGERWEPVPLPVRVRPR